MDWNVVFYEEVDSTNLEARRLSQNGVKQGLVVMAETQSAGKGRRGRTWQSQAGGNLYFSILLRPNMAPEKAPRLTLLMAYSVVKALRRTLWSDNERNSAEYTVGETTFKIQIKWPNDVIVADKKVCGILTEMTLNGSEIDDVIVGVGVNVNATEFAEEIKEKATSLERELGRKIEREVLLQAILQEFERRYEDFLRVQDLSLIQEEYNQMLVNRGREVLVLEPGSEYRAQALGMNDAGELLVQKDDGSIECVFAGEVSVRGVYGYV